MPFFKGIRARLLLALAGVAALTLMAAIAAIGALLRVGDDLTRIVEREVPGSFTAYEVSQISENVAAASARLSVVQTPDQRNRVYADARSHYGLLRSRLGHFRRW